MKPVPLGRMLSLFLFGFVDFNGYSLAQTVDGPPQAPRLSSSGARP